MSGHSKWANIKHRKGAQDKRRGKLFNRLIREIMLAVRQAGNNPESNPALRMAIQNARGANLPGDKIDNAIKKASGMGSEVYQEISYEAYGPGGVALFIETATDNPNRTVSSIRTILSRNGGSLSTSGSLNFVFIRKGVITLPLKTMNSLNEDELELSLVEAGAEDIEKEQNNWVITIPFEEFGNFQKRIEQLQLIPENASVQRIPLLYKLLDTEEALKMFKLIEKLEDDEDVQTVYHNIEWNDSFIDEMEMNS